MLNNMFKIDWWVILGLVAQGLFFGRFFVQWLVSEKKGESTVPLSFWFFSIFGGGLLLIYAIHQQDIVFTLGQAGGLVIYLRNLMLIYRKHQRDLKRACKERGTTMLADAKISLVIPAKNESASIHDIINQAKPFVAEVLVIDGHSTDTTREVAEQAGARVVLDNRKGKGDGLRVGIREAAGNIIVFIDADGSHDPHDIPRLVQPIIDGKADMVIGSRMTGGSDELHGDFSRFIRMTGSHILLLVINYRWNIRLTDCQNGFRAIRTDVARAINLTENVHTIEEEMVMKCLKHKYIIGEVPSHEYERKFGGSTLNLLKTWYQFGWCILKNFF